MSTPDSINRKAFSRLTRSPWPQMKQLAEQVREGNRGALARAITLVESTLPAHRELAAELTDLILPFTGNSRRIGITGIPGVGKSTFIESFGLFLLSEPENRVAVLAVDPSSSKSGGSILGDKTRMEKLSTHDRAFVRPSPSAGSLGGVAARTRESLLLCEAAGFNYLLVETVGVGQSEVAVSSMTDVFILLMISGAGDDLQGIKRGIMEMADGIFINKADGDNLARARKAMAELKQAVHLFPPTAAGLPTEVHLISALEKTGLEECSAWLERYLNHGTANGSFAGKRREQNGQWLRETLHSRILDDFEHHPAVHTRFLELRQAVMEEKRSPASAVQELITLWRDQSNS